MQLVIFSTSDQMVYVVKQGDSLETIAESLLGDSKYSNDIRLINQLGRDDTLHIGQKIIIPDIDFEFKASESAIENKGPTLDSEIENAIQEEKVSLHQKDTVLSRTLEEEEDNLSSMQQDVELKKSPKFGFMANLGFYYLDQTYKQDVLDLEPIEREAVLAAPPYVSEGDSISNLWRGIGAMNSALDGNPLTTEVTGADNSAFGNSVLSQLQTGSRNTAIGSGSLFNVVSGNQNVAVGGQSGFNLVTGNSNTLVGYQSTVNDEDAINQTVIGSDAVGVEDNSVTLGNADVDAVYMGSDSEATVYAGNINITGAISGVTTIDASGNVSIGGSLNAGATSISSLVSSGNVSVGGAFGVSGVATLTGGLSAGPTTVSSLTVGSGENIFAFPTSDGSDGDVLSTNGGGVLSWTTPTATASSSSASLGGSIDLLLDSDSLYIGHNPSGNTDFSSPNFNVSLGTTALADITTGDNNTAVGYDALHNNKEGNFNSAFGVSALKQNKSGMSNNAFGVSALEQNESGQSNNAFGVYALQFNKTGQFNSAFGNSALQDNTASNNSAFGAYALSNNEGGEQNSAFGFSALYSNTTGTNNNAFGANTLKQNVLGQSNSAFGNSALHDNTDGNFNSAFGVNALNDNTTGEYNSAFGYQAGKAIKGSENSVFGYQAGDTIISGEKNVVIGHGADVSAATATNQIVIGANAVGQGDNTVQIGNDEIEQIYLGGTNLDNVYFGNGNATLHGSTSTTSDRRYKKNIENSNLGLGFILKLESKQYNYINQDDESKVYHGFMAQDVRQHLDDLGVASWNGWNIDANGKQGLDYSAFTIPLVNAVQAHHGMITRLEERVFGSASYSYSTNQSLGFTQTSSNSSLQLSSVDATTLASNTAAITQNKQDIAKNTVDISTNRSLIQEYQQSIGSLENLNTSVKEGMSSQDVVGALNALDYVSQERHQLIHKKVDSVRKEANAGIAMAHALSSIETFDGEGFYVSAGTGFYQSQVAVGLMAAYQKDSYAISGGVAFSDQEVSGRAGLSLKIDPFNWKKESKASLKTYQNNTVSSVNGLAIDLNQQVSAFRLSHIQKQEKKRDAQIQYLINQNKHLQARQDTLEEKINRLENQNQQLIGKLDALYEWVQKDKVRAQKQDQFNTESVSFNQQIDVFKQKVCRLISWTGYMKDVCNKPGIEQQVKKDNSTLGNKISKKKLKSQP